MWVYAASEYTNDYLAHYGIKGMRWGVRRFQYADGTYTPAGMKRYDIGVSDRYGRAEKAMKLAALRVDDLQQTARTVVPGRQYVDGYIKKGTTFSRVQTANEFENHAFYATYKKQDVDKYLGLFGNNLTKRANAAARAAEKKAKQSGDEEDLFAAKEAREYADNLKVYQVKIRATKKLKVPSDENAGHIVSNLLKEREFRENFQASIDDSKSKMKRPSQQVLFKNADRALRKDPSRLTATDKVNLYKALNLSLTNHNEAEIAAQERFYSELKKKGYNALLDYNDKDFSSYHAQRPMIVFDIASVKLQAISEADPKLVDSLYKKYNAERIAKEIPANTKAFVNAVRSVRASEYSDYVKKRTRDYYR